MGDRSAVARHRTSVLRRGRRPAPRLDPRRAHGRPARRGATLGAARQTRLHRGARCHDRWPGRRDAEGRSRGDLSFGLAGGGGRQPLRTDVPGPVALPGELCPGRRPPVEQCADARRPDRVVRGPRHPAAPADRRGCRGRVRRCVERVRADAIDDRGRCRRRALRGPARQREEVRAPGRQGPGPDGAVRAHADRRPSGGRRARRALTRRRADRRARGHAAHVRCRRTRRPLHHRDPHARRLLPGGGGDRRRDRPRIGLRAVRRHVVVRDVHTRPGSGASVRGRDPGPSSPASSWRTTARRRSTGSSTWTTRRSRGSRRSSGRWATGSSSSRWQGSTR